MKKFMTIAMALALVVMMFAACANDDSGETTLDTSADISSTIESEAEAETTEDATPAIEGADKLLSAVWADIAEDEKYFVSGGDMNNMVDGDAGLVTDTDYMIYNLHFPEELHASVDQVASLIHGMNANSMTTAVYHLTEGTDAATFAESMRDTIQSTQWMCGFPEQLYIASVGEYVLVSYGLTDNVAAIESHLTAVYPAAQMLISEAILG